MFPQSILKPGHARAFFVSLCIGGHRTRCSPLTASSISANVAQNTCPSLRVPGSVPGRTFPLRLTREPLVTLYLYPAGSGPPNVTFAGQHVQIGAAPLACALFTTLLKDRITNVCLVYRGRDSTCFANDGHRFRHSTESHAAVSSSRSGRLFQPRWRLSTWGRPPVPLQGRPSSPPVPRLTNVRSVSRVPDKGLSVAKTRTPPQLPW